MGRPLKSEQEKATAAAAAQEARMRLALEHAHVGMQARDDLLRFTEYLSPDRAFPEDPKKTRYIAARHHKALCEVLMDVEAGRKLRVIVTMPPQHGKSELSTRKLPAWAMGRAPYKKVICGSYNQTKAEDFGKDVLDIFKDPSFAKIFPSFALDPSAKSASHIRTLDGGKLIFSGLDGSATGYGADLLIIDDPFKSDADAASPALRDKVWAWFLNVGHTRLAPSGAIIIVLTRWHEDDLVGRILNPAYVPEDLAAGWHVINLPALAEANDPLGREVGEALWPERYNAQYLDNIRRMNPRGFISLYQQRPAPEEGAYFRKEMVKTYGRDHLPKRLRYYGVSDHAVTKDPQRDASCFIVFGVDEHDDVWIVDCWWGREEALQASERLLGLIKRWNPLRWFPADDNIFKTFRPFLDKRMREEDVWCVVDPIREGKDIEARAQAIHGRMDQGRVRFPQGEPWLADAIGEIMAFPNAKHDDFVAALSLIGLALGQIIRSSRPANTNNEPPPVGSIHWTIWAAKREEAAKTRGVMRWTA